MSLNRRAFLKESTLGLAAASAAPLLAGDGAVASPDNTAAHATRPTFHSRHIPIEHLNLETQMGKAVVRNGLCDTIKPDVLKRIRDLGVELVEMRVVWWEFEPESGRFDWSRTLRDMDAVLNAGLKVGMFAWFHYPPKWYDPDHRLHARLRAVDRDAESNVLSLWDPKTIDVFDRLMGVAADALKGRLSFIVHAISGNYGEFHYGVSACHYQFSSPTGGYLLGDRCAKASFAGTLQRKYGSVEALNAAWGTKMKSFDDDLIPKLPFSRNSLQQRDDCMQWATGSMLDFADRACGLYKKHFPGIDGALPLGFVGERIETGQIKSLAAKLAAKHGVTARWTGCAHLQSFDRSHLPARRIASSAHFYGAPFGTEAALTINADNAANALYESQANGASLVHDDPQNMFRALAVHERLRPKLLVDPPDTSVAVFYPVEDELLSIDGFSWKLLLRRCADFRRLTDYDVCDSFMIADGYLKTKRDLIIPVSSHLREETACAVAAFAAKNGRVWLYEDTELTILLNPLTFEKIAARYGLTEHDTERAESTGLYRFTDWQQTIPYIVPTEFKIPSGGTSCIRTMHKRHESCYYPERQDFEIRQKFTG